MLWKEVLSFESVCDILKCENVSSWIYENVLSENISTLTKILLNRTLNKSSAF